VTWLIAGLLSFGLAGIAYKLKLLTMDGAITAFILGFLLYGIGEIAFSFSVVYFFLTANLLGKFKRHQLSLTQKQESRNAAQVLANGIVPLLLLILWGVFREPILIFFFLTAICTATADTWATELGALSKNPPRSILNLKKVRRGVSGGISPLGTVAACTGAYSNTQLSALFFSQQFNMAISLQNIFLISFAAILAQFVDSLLGACCQVRYFCASCGKIVEEKYHCSQPATTTSGLKWLTNDMVNFISILTGIFIFWMCLKIV